MGLKSGSLSDDPHGLVQIRAAASLIQVLALQPVRASSLSSS